MGPSPLVSRRGSPASVVEVVRSSPIRVTVVRRASPLLTWKSSVEWSDAVVKESVDTVNTPGSHVECSWV